MKYLKYCFIILLIAVFTDAALVYAYDSPAISIFTLELKGNNSQYTDYKTKTTWTVQTYKNISTDTALTSPCTDCKIAAKPYNKNGDVGSGVITVAGQTKSFTDPTSINIPGDYRLNVWRYDFSLLTTLHNAAWNINSN